MSRDRHSRHRHGSGRNQQNSRHGREELRQEHEENRSFEKNQRPAFKSTAGAVSQSQIRENEEAIRTFKSSVKFVCAICGEPINEILSSLSSKDGTGNVHFDCALKEIEKTEHLETGDKISYIGQGRFGVINYANVHDIRHFTIRKIIEWEKTDSPVEWRTKMCDLYSKVR